MGEEVGFTPVNGVKDGVEGCYGRAKAAFNAHVEGFRTIGEGEGVEEFSRGWR